MVYHFVKMIVDTLKNDSTSRYSYFIHICTWMTFYEICSLYFCIVTVDNTLLVWETCPWKTIWIFKMLNCMSAFTCSVNN